MAKQKIRQSKNRSVLCPWAAPEGASVEKGPDSEVGEVTGLEKWAAVGRDDQRLNNKKGGYDREAHPKMENAQ